MKINRAYVFRFYPTPAQKAQLAIEFGHARWVWNWALELRQKAYQQAQADISMNEVGKALTQLKQDPDHVWLKNAHLSGLTQKLADLDTAYANFFARRAKFPRFKKRKHQQSVRFQLDQRNIAKTFTAGVQFKVPSLGAVEIVWSKIPQGVPKMVTIKKTPDGKFWVSIACEEDSIPFVKTGKSIGLDIGVKSVLVTSEGTHSEPKNQRLSALAQTTGPRGPDPRQNQSLTLGFPT